MTKTFEPVSSAADARPEAVSPAREILLERMLEAPFDGDEAAMIRAVGFRFLIGEDFRTHERDPFAPGLHTLWIHRIGVHADNLRPPLRQIARVVHRLGQLFCRNFYGIEIERSVRVGRRLEIGHQSGIVIHRHATIGHNCVIRQGVTFGVGTDWIEGKGPVIGNGVRFGVGSVVMGNVTIGDRVTVGPNCVISSDVAPDCTLFLPPPRVLPKARPATA
ncbi:serine O-acetyltransferase [Cereibacter sphaeroides]|uniref:serine O-acetyltransferase n=1 Tax=Cereibacter sphaeroides TaxID=1063 RepID=UPI0000664DFA|nr:transferase hexapeptide repeat containing protein [Cereibacter sphaeroides ATCC 17029]